MTQYRKTLCLDFDGVLHSYTSPWAGATVVPDPPVTGAYEFVLAALAKFDVCVLSSRSHEPGGRDAMALWLVANFGGEVAGTDDDGLAWHPGGLGVSDRVTFPLHKPPAFVTLDDRALTFTGRWPDVAELERFKPWNRREPGGLDAERAVRFSLSIDDHYDSREFLQAWLEGDTSEWPEFGEGAGREGPVTSSETSEQRARVEVPEDGSDDADFWLEAVYQHGFREVDAHGPEGRDGQGFRCTAGQVLKLMASAREQGRRDVLGLPSREPE